MSEKVESSGGGEGQPTARSGRGPNDRSKRRNFVELGLLVLMALIAGAWVLTFLSDPSRPTDADSLRMYLSLPAWLMLFVVFAPVRGPGIPIAELVLLVWSVPGIASRFLRGDRVPPRYGIGLFLAVLMGVVSSDLGTRWQAWSYIEGNGGTPFFLIVSFILTFMTYLGFRTSRRIGEAELREGMTRVESKPNLGGILLMGSFLCVYASLSVFFYLSHTRWSSDRAANADGQKLGAALERLRNELGDMNCVSRWKFEEKQLVFLVGPYYGWRGTTERARVKLKVVGDECRVCSMNGTRHGPAGKDRVIYRFELPTGRELPDQVGPCYGNAYGGSGGMCFTESIVNSDCSPRYQLKGEATPEEEAACETIARDYDKVAPSLSALAKSGINPFGVALYHVSRAKGSDNLFFGPLTAYAQFFTTAEITKDETQQEILKALGLKEANASRRVELESLIKAVRCSVITGGGQYSITDEFWKDGRDFFRPLDTSVEQGNRGRGSEPHSQESNRPQGSETPSADMPDCPPNTNIDIGWKNVTHFLGKWGDGLEFAPSSTQDSTYFQLDGNHVTVPMMYKRGAGYLYMENRELQALQIPYGGAGLGMLFVLPRNKKGLPDIEESLTARKLEEWTNSLHIPPQDVKVWIPRFGVSTQVDWTGGLDAISIRRIFSWDKCRFDRDRIPLFIKNPELKRCPARMSYMAQQAWVEVNEKGTEAYVAGINCAQITAGNGGDPPEPPPLEFRADHPFLFIVRHIPSGTIVFMGRYTVP